MSTAVFDTSRPRPLLIAIATALIVLMFYLGAQPIAAGLFPRPWDKLAHFIAYATLTVLFRIGIGGDQLWRLVVLIGIIGIIGSLDEWHQIFMRGRSAELADLATDVTAAVVAILACEWYANSRKPSLPPPEHSNQRTRTPTCVE